MKACTWSLVSLLFSMMVFVESSAAADWPQWQGPDRNAISQERGLLQEWPQAGPPLAWQVKELGGGDSAPAIAAGKVFGMSNRGADEVVWALSETDGSELWVARLGPAVAQAMRQSQEGPGCTPTVDGDRLYVLGMGGALVCLRVDDGTIVWQRSLPKDFGGQAPMWSYRESPLVDGDKIICTPGGADATLLALDKLTGETIWKSQATPPAASGGADGPARGGPGGRGGRGGFGGFGRGPSSGAAYSSAIAIDFEGQRQYVQLLANTLIGVAAADGKVLWRYDAPANRMGFNCTTPLYHDGHVFAASAYGAGGGLVKLNKSADGGVTAEEVWFSKSMQNHHGGVILHEGCLYGANGGNGGGYFVCLDLQTGETLWYDRGTPKGSVTLADGRLYYRTEEGAMLLIEPNREQLIERGRFEQPDRSDLPAWAHPVVANGKLYVRDQDVLFCYEVKARGE